MPLIYIENGATIKRVKESGRTENKHFAEATNKRNMRCNDIAVNESI